MVFLMFRYKFFTELVPSLNELQPYNHFLIEKEKNVPNPWTQANLCFLRCHDPVSDKEPGCLGSLAKMTTQEWMAFVSKTEWWRRRRRSFVWFLYVCLCVSILESMKMTLMLTKNKKQSDRSLLLEEEQRWK